MVNIKLIRMVRVHFRWEKISCTDDMAPTRNRNDNKDFLGCNLLSFSRSGKTELVFLTI